VGSGPTGNDFIPHLPTLDIGEGGLNTLFDQYKALLPTLPGYLTNMGKVCPICLVMHLNLL